ncbi:MAG: 50S ribosomal protein L11 methyltransferase [Deltaproteobacteria bacterium]|nr:50S ribosomal protein L11 methyltransferase [Deltaproteobacteria bacterium]
MSRLAEIVVDVPAGARDAAERVAYGAGAQGIEVRDADTGAPRGRVQIVWWTSERARAVTVRAVRGRLSTVRDARVASRVIEATWLPPPRPQEIGDRFVVIGLDDEAPRGARVALRVDAALGFGDGLHPTTVLCVEALERHVSGGARVLDVGTGTGILALCAARLGAREVVATDVDPLARHAARTGLAANGVRATVRAALPRARFDVVVANLYLEPLLALAAELAARVDGGGRLIVSGFGTDSRPRVVDALCSCGLHVVARRTRAGFCCVVFARPTRPRDPGPGRPRR